MDQPGKPVRILSIDGGGIRGMSALYILRELMAQIERLRGIMRPPPPPTEALRPCDIFDLICGTSTGGLIALMLGRLEMVSVSVPGIL
jgi:patatin-like phospholipase/acyl hydrolase